MSKTLAEIQFKELLPPSISGDESVLAVAFALDTQLKSVQQSTKAVEILSRLNDQSDAVLDLLAWQFSVDSWPAGLTKAQKADLIQDSIDWHSRKGTPGAIKELLSKLGVVVDIKTYWDGRQMYEDAGGRKLDGTWKLDGSAKLMSYELATGLPYMRHWAEFVVRANTTDELWELIKQAVSSAKRACTHPIYLNTDSMGVLDVGATVESSIAIHQSTTVYRWLTLVLDGTWQLDGSVKLEQLDVEMTITETPV